VPAGFNRRSIDTLAAGPLAAADGKKSPAPKLINADETPSPSDTRFRPRRFRVSAVQRSSSAYRFVAWPRSTVISVAPTEWAQLA